MAGGEQHLHPALLTRTVRRSKAVSLQVRAWKHQREGEVNVSLDDPDCAPLQDDDPQQVSVSRALLVEEQVGLQDKPPPMVDAVSLLLRRKNRELLHDVSTDALLQGASPKPFYRDIPL